MSPAGAAQRLEREFGDVRIRLTRATGGVLSLSAGPGMLAVHGVRRGRVAVRGGSTPFEVTQNGALLMADCTVMAAVLRPSELISITVPVPPGEDVPSGARPAVGGETLLSGVIAFAGEVVTAVDREVMGVPHPHIELLVRDMVARLLTVEAVQEAPSPMRRALAVIMRMHADPRLGSRRIAEAVNLSVRQLERQFHAHGTTIAREVRHARLDAAVRLLSEDPTGLSSIDEIAHRVGFSGGSPLARAMLREGLPSPSAVRLGVRLAS
ncbi:AraC family transcriptional regulator [Microbacterium sp. Au-Mic1]|uniref:helix-turn-helix domain-containing protein n=1 Tax=Microbacterium sp. Au-Mic1 TaxID=2906457 RepID=UPI001E4FAF37|nr:AraC family transcriptional regulator [Microbacterium sp. Au-Mic1]MCE4027378.1 AraC family transcriptional regulator [Microbacterium sp. Au-Mic1]